VETATVSNVVEITKRCIKCGANKTASSFPRDNTCKSGFSGVCRACHTVRQRMCKANNQEKAKRKQLADSHKRRTKRIAVLTALGQWPPLERTTEEGRYCTRCKIRQPLDQFPRHAKASDGLRVYCRKCGNTALREARAKKPEAYKNYKLERTLKLKYGLTMATYRALLEAQGSRCAICRVGLEQRVGKIAVDHCHETNAVRGILCSCCNLAIGLFKENEDALRSAILYLRKARGDI
jgi:hypothetical protein